MRSNVHISMRYRLSARTATRTSGARRRVGRAEQPLAERDLVEPLGAHAHVDRSDRLDQPGRVDRFLVDAAQLARRIVGQIAAGEHARPEAARGGRRRRAVGIGLDARQRHRQVVGRAAERQRPQVRLAVGADAERQRLEALGARRGIRHPEAEREGAARRIELADDVVEIRQPSVVQLEQLLDEPIRARHLLEDHALPQRRDVARSPDRRAERHGCPAPAGWPEKAAKAGADRS